MIDYYHALKGIMKHLVVRAIKTDTDSIEGLEQYANIICIIGGIVVKIAEYVLDFEERSNYWGE